MTENTKSNGFFFEEAFEQAAVKVGCTVKRTSTYVDQYEGADFVVDGVRVDPTLDYGRKDKTDYLGSLVVGNPGNYFNIAYGYRKGNSHVDFSIPVLVVALKDCNSYFYNRNKNLVNEVLKKWGTEIVEKGMELFWDHYDELGETCLG